MGGPSDGIQNRLNKKRFNFNLTLSRTDMSDTQQIRLVVFNEYRRSRPGNDLAGLNTVHFCVTVGALCEAGAKNIATA